MALRRQGRDLAGVASGRRRHGSTDTEPRDDLGRPGGSQLVANLRADHGFLDGLVEVGAVRPVGGRPEQHGAQTHARGDPVPLTVPGRAQDTEQRLVDTGPVECRSRTGTGEVPLYELGTVGGGRSPRVGRGDPVVTGTLSPPYEQAVGVLDQPGQRGPVSRRHHQPQRGALPCRYACDRALGAWVRNTRGGVLRRCGDAWDTWVCLQISVMRACLR